MRCCCFTSNKEFYYFTGKKFHLLLNGYFSQVQRTDLNVFQTNIPTQDDSGLRAVADSQAPDLRSPGGIWGWGGVIALVGGPRPEACLESQSREVTT